MKNKTFRLLGLSAAFALTLALGITSCKKDKNDNGSSAAMSATVGADAFSTSVVVGTSHYGLIDIVGTGPTKSDTVALSLTFRDTVNTNANLDFKAVAVDLGRCKNSSCKSYSTQNTKTHGSLTITSVDKTNYKIAGKFSGVIYDTYGGNDSVVIKDGQFNTVYKPI
jgi:hypothetical protein